MLYRELCARIDLGTFLQSPYTNKPTYCACVTWYIVDIYKDLTQVKSKFL